MITPLMLICWCVAAAVAAGNSAAAAKTADSWLQRQSQHEPVALERYALLETVAVLSEKHDPEGQLFDSLLRPLLTPRYVTTKQHDRVRQHLVDTMTALGWHVQGNATFWSSTPRGTLPFTNVVATHDIHATRRLVVACHYDSIYGRKTFTAATDSAVPCAMMLYLASLVTAKFLDPMRARSDLTLQLMFFDGEEAIERWTDEDSIYGSRHLAAQLHKSLFTDTGRTTPTLVNNLRRIDLLVLLDLLGAASPRISNYIDNSGQQFQHLAHVEKKLARAALLPPHVSKIFRYKRSWGLFGRPYIQDDHLPFLERGVKVLHIIPNPFPDVWHRDLDNESAIHYPTVDYLGRVLRVFVLEYLNAPAYLPKQ